MGGKVLVLDVVLVINIFKYLLFPSDSILVFEATSYIAFLAPSPLSF